MNRLILLLLFVGLIYLIVMYHTKLKDDFKRHRSRRKKRSNKKQKNNVDSSLSLNSAMSSDVSIASVTLDSASSK